MQKEYEIWLEYSNIRFRDIALRSHQYEEAGYYAGILRNAIKESDTGIVFVDDSVKDMEDDEIKFYASMNGLAQDELNAWSRHNRIYVKFSVLYHKNPLKELKQMLKDVLSQDKYYNGCWEGVKILNNPPEIDTRVWHYSGRWWRVSYYSEVFSKEEYEQLKEWHSYYEDCWGERKKRNLLEYSFGDSYQKQLDIPTTIELELYKEELKNGKPFDGMEFYEREKEELEERYRRE